MSSPDQIMQAQGLAARQSDASFRLKENNAMGLLIVVVLLLVVMPTLLYLVIRSAKTASDRTQKRASKPSGNG